MNNNCVLRQENTTYTERDKPGHKHLAERISTLGWFNYQKYVIDSMGKAHLKASECANALFYLQHSTALLNPRLRLV